MSLFIMIWFWRSFRKWSWSHSSTCEWINRCPSLVMYHIRALIIALRSIESNLYSILHINGVGVGFRFCSLVYEAEAPAVDCSNTPNTSQLCVLLIQLTCAVKYRWLLRKCGRVLRPWLMQSVRCLSSKNNYEPLLCRLNHPVKYLRVAHFICESPSHRLQTQAARNQQTTETAWGWFYPLISTKHNYRILIWNNITEREPHLSPIID
jgi:hypothetical protein